MKICTIIFATLLVVTIFPQVLFAEGKHNMNMNGDHSKMMSHPGKMDEHMMTHHEHIKTMERVFRYDRNLAENTNSIKVGYLYKLDNAEAEEDKDAMVMMSKTMIEDGLSGKDISFDPIGISPSNNLNNQLSKADINVVYIGYGLSEDELNGAKEFAVQKKLLTIGSSSKHAEQGITAVGIVVHNNKVDLIINLKTAEELAANFDPRLFRLADNVIK